MPLVELAITDRVATLTLNNPAERNTLTDEMVGEILAAMDEVEATTTGPCPPSSRPPRVSPTGRIRGGSGGAGAGEQPSSEQPTSGSGATSASTATSA